MAPRSALILATIWALSLGAFALAGTYPLALAALAVAGFTELSFSSMVQTLVQMNAPDATRGRVLGLFNMASSGLRAFSGIVVGVVGAQLGVHTSLAIASGCFVAVALFLLARLRTASAATASSGT
jgi:MFS family permease